MQSHPQFSIRHYNLYTQKSSPFPHQSIDEARRLTAREMEAAAQPEPGVKRGAGELATNVAVGADANVTVVGTGEADRPEPSPEVALAGAGSILQSSRRSSAGFHERRAAAQALNWRERT